MKQQGNTEEEVPEEKPEAPAKKFKDSDEAMNSASKNVAEKEFELREKE